MRLSHVLTLRDVSSLSPHAVQTRRNAKRSIFLAFLDSLGAPGLRWTGKLNTPLYRLSGGRVGGKVGKAPVLLLTTTGRKSGQQRTAPIVYLRTVTMVVINTNAGNAKVPAWSLNLRPTPRPRSRSAAGAVVARVAEGEERADLWRKHNVQYAGFDEYKRSSTANQGNRPRRRR